MSFFFAQNQLKDSDDKLQQTPNKDEKEVISNSTQIIQEALKAISLDEKIDALKQEIINELRKQEISINSTITKQLKENKDNENENELLSFALYLPLILLGNIWKFVGIIPYLGPLLQLLIIVNIICFIFSLVPKELSSVLIFIIKYIAFTIIPLLFSPLINSCKALAFDSAFLELRHLIAYAISQVKDLLLSDMFQGVYNTKILSSLNMSSFNVTASVGEVLGDDSISTLSDTYSYFKDSINKIF